MHLDLAGLLPESHCEFGKDIGIDMIFTAKDELSNDKNGTMKQVNQSITLKV